MERGREYCSFCCKTHEKVAHLFVAANAESAICDKCILLVGESYRQILAGDIEYASWAPSPSAAGDADKSLKEKP